MEQSYEETLMLARERAARQISDPRERSIIIRYIEDAICRSIGASQLPVLAIEVKRG